MASHRKVHVDSEKQLGMAPLRNIQNREPLLDGHAVLVDAQLFCFCPGEVWPPFFVGSLGPLFGPGPPGDDRKANVFKFSYARICSADDPDLPPSTKPTSAGKVALPNWQSSICQFNWRKTYFAAGNTRFAIKLILPAGKPHLASLKTCFASWHKSFCQPANSFCQRAKLIFASWQKSFCQLAKLILQAGKT